MAAILNYVNKKAAWFWKIQKRVFLCIPERAGGRSPGISGSDKAS